MKFCVTIGKTTSSTTPILLEGDFVKSVYIAKEIGYDAVEIHTPNPETLNTDELIKVCDSLGMFIATLGTGIIYSKYGLHLADENKDNSSRLIAMVKVYIDIAAKLRSKVTIGSIKGNMPKDKDRQKYLDIIGKNLKTVSDYAVEKGVFVLLEATNRYENNIINTGRDIYDMIKNYNLKNFQGLMDTFHINIEEPNLQTCLSDVGEYLGHIHFSDNIRMYPGSGAFNFDAFCHSIKKIGYDGVLSAECYPLPDGITAARESIKFFKKYFQ
jgi:sugar phosphate isomerase/epimerase